MYSFYTLSGTRLQSYGVKSEGDECFIFIYSSGKHQEFIIEEILDTVARGYRILIKKFFYVEAREKLLARLFSIAEKRGKKLGDSHPGISFSLGIFLYSTLHWWVGVSGEVIAHFLFDNKSTLLEKNQGFTHLSGFNSQKPTIFFTNSLVGAKLSPSFIQAQLERCQNQNELETGLMSLLDKAAKNDLENGYGGLAISV